MILAAIDGDWVVPLVVVVFGFINWVAGKLKGEATPPATTRPAPTAPPRAGTNSEEERMRKFLEALGVPAETAPAPTRPIPRQPPPLPPAPPKRVARPARARPAAEAPPPVMRERSLDEDPKPTLPVEQIHIADLVVPTFAEFATVSSSIGAIPMERPAAVAAAAGPTAAELVRQNLRSPEQLRSAFLLREILGPPRSLQT